MYFLYFLLTFYNHLIAFLYAFLSLGSIGGGVEIALVECDAKFATQFGDKLFIPVRLLAPQVEVAMGSLAPIAQLQQTA